MNKSEYLKQLRHILDTGQTRDRYAALTSNYASALALAQNRQQLTDCANLPRTRSERMHRRGYISEIGDGRIRLIQSIDRLPYGGSAARSPYLSKTTPGCLCIYNSRDQNKEEITSTVVLHDPDLVSIHVGYWYRTSRSSGGSQFWRHYRAGVCVEWKTLTDDERERILEAYNANAPAWAKTPGKLRANYKPWNWERKTETDNAGYPVGYKWLNVWNDGYRSPIHGDDWINGELTAPIPTTDNECGIYCAKNPEATVLLHYAQYSRALVQLQLSGTIVESVRGFRAEHAVITGIVKVI